MPEFVADRDLRKRGASAADVRIFMTLVAALDRARDADRLWAAAATLHRETPWVFAENEVRQASLSALVDALASAGVSQRHLIDAATWRTCLESLHDPEAPEPVRAAVFEGRGTVSDVLSAVSADRPSGQPWFPYLRGPKVSVMWVRMLVEPGGAALDELRILPVTVDVQVRKVTEYLGIADTRDIDLEAARPVIQEAWQRLAGDAVGPASLSGTTAALDPALWFFAKWGCTFCERAKRKMPIHSVCEACSLGGNR